MQILVEDHDSYGTLNRLEVRHKHQKVFWMIKYASLSELFWKFSEKAEKAFWRVKWNRGSVSSESKDEWIKQMETEPYGVINFLGIKNKTQCSIQIPHEWF